jgi:hypothetical protein
MSTVGPLGGGTGDLGAPAINAKKCQWWALCPYGGFGPHPGSARCVVNMHGYDRQKAILLTGLAFPAQVLVMADDP